MIRYSMKYSIIGAGIGGLTTALAFEKIGIDYVLFERAPELSEVGAGIWLAPNSLQVLDSLGVLAEVSQKGNVINRITIGQQDLTPISDNFQQSIQEKFGFTTIAIHRARLQQILIDKIPKEKLHLGKSFESFNELPDGTIEIHFEDNSTYQTDYLIGADGIHSKVRKQMFPQSQIRHSRQTCWRGVSNFQLDAAFQHRGIELWGNQIRFGMSKLSESKVYWFAVAVDKANQKDHPNGIQNKLLAMYDSFHPLIKELITATPEDKILNNDLLDVKPMDNWHRNNICLIGDAAHATTPNMGQGGAQAIEDAYYMSQVIEKNPGTNHFELFQQKRQSKVNAIVNQSWNTGKLAHIKYGKRLRNFFIKNAPKGIIEKKMLELYTLEQ